MNSLNFLVEEFISGTYILAQVKKNLFISISQNIFFIFLTLPVLSFVMTHKILFIRLID